MLVNTDNFRTMVNLLKRVELNGFKSFAVRTVLEFPAGITAIVGPNGSGKSNVVDAIRWLLGERDAKNLRGARIEDLIFAGTAKRPRVGQAQASLHFDNSGRLFPVDATEVSVLREVRRDGTSRYFLNKAEVRLKDLVDFFAKARLGTKGLTVVSQGNSDVFIQAAPTGRREMIEEMLGLREYQLKRVAAENRLKSSTINLEKARALTEEILPHLRSLKRQAGRWEKRGALEQELRELENLFFGSQWHEFHTHRGELESGIKAHQAERAMLERERNDAEARVREVEAAEPKEREELRKIKQRTQELLQRQSHVQKNLGRLETQLELGREVASEAQPEIEELVKFIRRIQNDLELALDMDVVELHNTIENVIHEITVALSADSEPVKSKHAPSDLAEELQEVTKELKLIQKELGVLREDEERLGALQANFYTSFKAAMALVQRAKDKIDRWEAENQKRLFEVERTTLRLEDLEHQIAQAGRSPQEFAALQVQGGTADFDALEKRIFKLRGDLASIGEVDTTIIKEAEETTKRYEFLTKQSKDLEKAQKDLHVLIAELSEKIKTEFGEALGKINEEFNNFFRVMFGGGQAKLKLRSEPRPAMVELNPIGASEVEQGIEVDVKLPRKRASSLEMLSGGERSLVGIAALFALISVSPPPFLVLDEIDAALDDRNARRFAQILKDFSKKTQFIVVTHNRATMEGAHILYGVTLNDDGTSKILSVKLETAPTAVQSA